MKEQPKCIFARKTPSFINGVTFRVDQYCAANLERVSCDGMLAKCSYPRLFTPPTVEAITPTPLRMWLADKGDC